MKKLYEASTFEESWLFIDDDSYTLEELAERFRKKKIASEYKQMYENYREYPESYGSWVEYKNTLQHTIEFYRWLPISAQPVEEVDGYKIILEKKEGN